ncbi:MAG: ATP-binding protein [Candidatus Sulfotelmatobacter sp.]
MSMTSLPMPASCIEQQAAASSPLPRFPIGNAAGEDEQFLLRAFRSFSEAAGSLERSYARLREEVERLRLALEISDRDLARSLEENRNMREHLDRILEGLPCGVLVVSASGRITRINPEAMRLLQVSSSRVNGVTKVLALPAAVQELLERARQDDREQELRVAETDGSLHWLAARHAPIAGGDSVFILRDIEERKRLEQTEARLRREQALAEVSAVLAHEIRNPLGSLELFAGLLAESELDGESRQWVEHMQAGLRTLAATVNNVLHFHSLPEPERVAVDLGELLEWARNFFLPLAGQSHVVLSLQNHVSGVLLAADRHRLEQVLLNLVLNSVRAMPAGGWIELGGKLLADGKSVALHVADNGPGISAENLPRLFEPGFSTRAGSPGLGLAVCRKIVEQHRGTIHTASDPGRGAKFTLIFPLAAPSIEGIVS